MSQLLIQVTQKRENLSYAEMSRQCKMSASHLSLVLRRKVDLTPEVCKRLADWLGMSRREALEMEGFIPKV
jgi:transcriptional regulator with XRE-family HTH domain